MTSVGDSFISLTQAGISEPEEPTCSKVFRPLWFPGPYAYGPYPTYRKNPEFDKPMKLAEEALFGIGNFRYPLVNFSISWTPEHTNSCTSNTIDLMRLGASRTERCSNGRNIPRGSRKPDARKAYR